MSSVDQFHGALVGEAMVERAKSVIVVAWRVGDDQAARLLLDAAGDAGIPVHLAADQIMTALGQSDGAMEDAMAYALAAIRPADGPWGHAA
ncbi:ANTAR domain-containing protein [Myceligenerans xiligouense]|uniref:ANTAR domain-containing protein n=1 Tax=Myceligenerans xiligouense TaxID=253184 RepID=A0A3N4YTH9_9MICO|nr:ANTAR domain-containing protein [Myceligenerans xiligouense]RPF21890.1 ANTAR domain-containing protein [Myceligenerans xiligouense]